MKTCAICEKGSVTGGKRSFLRSHYNPTNTVRKYPNLQWAKLPISSKMAGQNGSSGMRVKVCTKCIKKLHKETAR